MEKIDIKEYFEKFKEKKRITDSNFNYKFTQFLVNNNWFGLNPFFEDNHLYVYKKDLNKIKNKIEFFADNYNLSINKKIIILQTMAKRDYPQTYKYFCEYKKCFSMDSSSEFYLLDFILTFFPGELASLNDREIAFIVEDAFRNLTRYNGDILLQFFEWVKENHKTIYRETFYFKTQKKPEEEVGAYDEETFLKIFYCIFNEDYIEENEMYIKAANSKGCTDTWLHMCICFLNEIRNSDVRRIPHPKLTMSPYDVLKKIKENKFSDDDARQTLYSVVWHLNVIRFAPNKTKKYSGINDAVFNIPVNCEVHMGKLFALAEAHYQIKYKPKPKHINSISYLPSIYLDDPKPEPPLIQPITDYERINRYMGEEIGNLFLKGNFRTKAATKSNLQMIFSLADEILETKDVFSMKGYSLASMARSHKKGYGEFAPTTITYLKDLRMKGLNAEFVGKELFNRGTLSSIPSMLLDMLTDGEYKMLSIENQTKSIKLLNLKLIEIEDSVNLANKTYDTSVSIVTEIYRTHSKDEILEILHRIGNGEAVSKIKGILCIVIAMKKNCPYKGKDKIHCLACEFEISTKSTMFLLCENYKELLSEYENATTNFEKDRKKYLINITLEKIDNIIDCAYKIYGKKAKNILSSIVEDTLNGK